MLTVVWMLCVTTALACELVALAAAVVVRSARGGARIAALGELMLFAALVVGLVALALIPAVVRLRAEPPPTSVLIFAVFVGVAPWIMILAARVF